MFEFTNDTISVVASICFPFMVILYPLTQDITGAESAISMENSCQNMF